MKRLPHIPWPHAHLPQFEDAEVRVFKNRMWVPLELAESKLQWWQARDWDSGRRVTDLEDELEGLRKPTLLHRLFAIAQGDAA